MYDHLEKDIYYSTALLGKMKNQEDHYGFQVLDNGLIFLFYKIKTIDAYEFNSNIIQGLLTL